MQVINHIEVHNGEARILGRNLKAKMVARMVIWEKRSISEVMEHYNLSAAEVHAALVFYYDNQESLDAEYRANLETLKEVGMSADEFRAKIEARNQDT